MESRLWVGEWLRDLGLGPRWEWACATLVLGVGRPAVLGRRWRPRWPLVLRDAVRHGRRAGLVEDGTAPSWRWMGGGVGDECCAAREVMAALSVLNK